MGRRSHLAPRRHPLIIRQSIPVQYKIVALNVGSRLGHYDVTALIGEEGMGQVYQATDTKLNRQVALKILPEAVASDPDSSDGGVCLTGTPCPKSRVLLH